MQVIRSVEELDAKIEECNRAEAISDDAMRAVFAGFRMDPPGGLPPDPFSDAYRQSQLTLYRDVCGRDYDTAHEVTAFDVEAAVHRPFPFSTGTAPARSAEWSRGGASCGTPGRLRAATPCGPPCGRRGSPRSGRRSAP